jgi:hypothetical protein
MDYAFAPALPSKLPLAPKSGLEDRAHVSALRRVLAPSVFEAGQSAGSWRIHVILQIPAVLDSGLVAVVNPLAIQV